MSLLGYCANIRTLILHLCGLKKFSQTFFTIAPQIMTTIKKNHMHRIAFKMQLYKGFEDEYKKRHDEIWPELQSLLKEAGISDYSIFLDEATNSLFGVMKAEDREKLNDLSSSSVMQKWWKYMGDIMESNPNHSPVSTPLTEVFYLP
jgi:L-rhamnose mutarotase